MDDGDALLDLADRPLSLDPQQIHPAQDYANSRRPFPLSRPTHRQYLSSPIARPTPTPMELDPIAGKLVGKLVGKLTLSLPYSRPLSAHLA